MNVAPEFGGVETGVYLLLARLEEDSFGRGLLNTKSDLRRVLQEQAVRSQRWRKWMVGDGVNLPVDEVMKDEKMVEPITGICGHYTFEIPRSKVKWRSCFGIWRASD